MIVFFAAIHGGFGLDDGRLYENCFTQAQLDSGNIGDLCKKSVIPSVPTALYFSAVTWATVGYGDYRPVPDLHLLTAIQAIMGYIYFGVVVGMVAAEMNSSQERNRQ
ncbi:potassium channel family protein [Alphaproteobacteria bacterium]|nr:potassium channel family protein [Alphaproteobacteria bacterium]